MLFLMFMMKKLVSLITCVLNNIVYGQLIRWLIYVGWVSPMFLFPIYFWYQVVLYIRLCGFICNIPWYDREYYAIDAFIDFPSLVFSLLWCNFPLVRLKYPTVPELPANQWMQCFHLQGFFPAARKYSSLQGMYKEIKFTRKNTKIKGNCKDFCNLYQLQVLNQ